MQKTGWYADVLLPLPLPDSYSYSIPEEIISIIKRGSHVCVELGNKKYHAVVKNIHQNQPKYNKVKSILLVFERYSLVSEIQFKFWKWMADYYMCTEGEVLKAALPPGVKFGKHNNEKKENFIKINPEISEEEINIVLDKLKRAPQQFKLLINYINLSDSFSENKINLVKKKDLLFHSGAGQSSLTALEKKNIFEVYPLTVKHIIKTNQIPSEPNNLNPEQQKAYNNICVDFTKRNVLLLHGITSSGKTEIYIHLILDQLNRGKQILYLLPEISITYQIISRLKKVFGNCIAVYHSKLNHSERFEIWNNIKSANDESYKIILGVRSSIFLPFNNLGLIIIDEEHENSYKQKDPSPRYNARDAAIILASIHGAKTILGTATPSIESFYNSKSGKYAFIELNNRYGGINLPEVIIADLKEARRKKQMKSLFTPILYNEMKSCLEKGEQIILFQNRRGYAPYLQCNECGWIPKCTSCDVSMTYHKYNNQLLCHYCGSINRTPVSCPKCNHTHILTMGSGTQKIEDEVELLFPDAKISRMDIDSTRSKKSFEKIIYDFQNNKSNILIGTQMVSKGFDFENVSLTGIINADNLLNYPDFRSFERSYQLMVQVSGRAGRKNIMGKVIIQTSDPKHHIIKHIVNNDYSGMFNMELHDRKEFNYPPFSRLIKIQLKHKNVNLVDKAGIRVFTNLLGYFGNNTLGPETPLISKINRYYIRNIYVKINKGLSISNAKEKIQASIQSLKSAEHFKSTLISVDVDPL